MDELGDKINSTIIAQGANVSCVPWSGSDVKIDYKLETGVPKEVQRKACVTTYEEALAATNKIGFVPFPYFLCLFLYLLPLVLALCLTLPLLFLTDSATSTAVKEFF